MHASSAYRRMSAPVLRIGFTTWFISVRNSIGPMHVPWLTPLSDLMSVLPIFAWFRFSHLAMFITSCTGIPLLSKFESSTSLSHESNAKAMSRKHISGLSCWFPSD